MICTHSNWTPPTDVYLTTGCYLLQCYVGWFHGFTEFHFTLYLYEFGNIKNVENLEELPTFTVVTYLQQGNVVINSCNVKVRMSNDTLQLIKRAVVSVTAARSNSVKVHCSTETREFILKFFQQYSLNINKNFYPPTQWPAVTAHLLLMRVAPQVWRLNCWKVNW